MKNLKILLLFITFFSFILETESQCIQEDALVVSPSPLSDPFTGGNPTYFPGQVIEFCYTIESYNGGSANDNWMHGIVPIFGPGWDQSTLVPIGQPQSVNENGEWIWTGNVIGTSTGNIVNEPGWWYDDNSGGGALNGDPGDNYGDGGSGSWTFCWQISTSECPPADNGASLVVEVTNYADGEMGSYDFEGCEDDPSLFFYANLNCPTCDETEVTVVQPNCKVTEGLAFVSPDGEGPWNITLLDPFGNVASINNNISGPFSLTDLSPNDYYIIVEDTFDGCLFTIPFTVEVPEDPIVDIQVFSTSCFGSSDGSINVTQVGEGVYEYIWTLPDGTFSNSEDLNNLAQGEYILDIYNSENFCSSTQIITVSEPDEISVDSELSDFSQYGVSCYGACDGYIEVDVFGGTGFELNPEFDDDCVSFGWSADLNNDGIDEYFSSDQNIYNLCPGTYNLISTDCNGCASSFSFFISEPDSDLIVNEVHSDYNGYGVSCNNGSDGFIDVSVTGGAGLYTYEWSNGSTTEDLNSIGAGTYTLTVTDQNGCSESIETIINEPPSVEILNTNISTVSCPGINDGSIEIDVTGGTPPYTFSWTSSSGYFSSNEDIFNLNSDNYNLIVTDSLNCSYDFSFFVNEEDSIILDELYNNISCFGANDGFINIGASGGTPPYSFIWNNGSNTPTIDNLSPGNYSLTVTDNNNCFQEIEILIQEPQPLTFEINTFDVTTCFGDQTGSAYLEINGGTPPYTTNWFGFNQNALNAGDYVVSVTDANGCYFEGSFTINQPQQLTMNIQTTDVLFCYGDASGTANIVINGGTPPYEINQGNINNLNQIYAGTYTISVTDINGCEVEEQIVINQPPLLNIDLSITNSLCPNDNSGQASVNIFGGSPPYSQSWTDNFGNIVNPNTLLPGQYQLTVSDQFNCQTTETFNVLSPEPDPLSLLIYDEIYCLNDFEVFAFGGIGTGTWSYSGPGNIQFSDPNNFSTFVTCSEYGIYELMYTDECGTVGSIQFTMQSDNPQVGDTPDSYCDFSSYLYSSSISDQGYWSLISAPDGENAVFDNFESQNTAVTVSNYGSYTFAYNSCGGYEEVEIEFIRDPNVNFVATYNECEQNALLFVDIPEGIDDGNFISINGPGNVTIESQSSNTIIFNVDEWGIYQVSYELCDIEVIANVGFSCPISIPNAFTPNNDGLNDFFTISGLDNSLHSNVLFYVYNRWGEVVYTQVNFNFDKIIWDGKIADLNNEYVSDGVYFYTLDLYNNASQAKERYQGNIYINTEENNN